jgi:hypothetical protein
LRRFRQQIIIRRFLFTVNRLHTVTCDVPNMAEKPVKCVLNCTLSWRFLNAKLQKYAIRCDEGLSVCLNVSRTTKIPRG